jgi:hypothetical protein
LSRIGQVEALVVRLTEFILVALLAGMVAMVFTNVVLRYGFNSGINFSEEMSRYFFVWLTFIGAVLAFREHGHIGVETFVRLLGPAGRIVCLALSNAIILSVRRGHVLGHLDAARHQRLDERGRRRHLDDLGLRRHLLHRRRDRADRR